jgi:hypothetical protein
MFGSIEAVKSRVTLLTYYEECLWILGGMKSDEEVSKPILSTFEDFRSSYTIQCVVDESWTFWRNVQLNFPRWKWELNPVSQRSAVVGFLIWGVLSDERMGLSFTVAAGLRQRSHYQDRVPQDSRYFAVSNLRLPQPGGPGPRIYIPQEHGGPIIPQALEYFF